MRQWTRCCYLSLLAFGLSFCGSSSSQSDRGSEGSSSSFKVDSISELLATTYDARIVGEGDILDVFTKNYFTIDIQEKLLGHGKSIVAKVELSDIQRSDDGSFQVVFGPRMLALPVYYRLQASQSQADSLRSPRPFSITDGYLIAATVTIVSRPLFSVQPYSFRDEVGELTTWELHVGDTQAFVAEGTLLDFKYFKEMSAH